MNNPDSICLLGVPELLVRAALQNAGGNEIESGKTREPGKQRRAGLQHVRMVPHKTVRAAALPPACRHRMAAPVGQVERQMRSPWRGGRHPWLDAAVGTEHHLIGIASKRYEPFRSSEPANLSDAYDRDVLGADMIRFTLMRDELRSGATSYRQLDAVQLVKHAFGLVTQGRRIGKAPALFYLYAEPWQHGSSLVTDSALALHRQEFASFTRRVVGGEVRFAACSYREYLAGWAGDVRAHAPAILARFKP
jgi:hypothetical protein